jgi:hypothetical protein
MLPRFIAVTPVESKPCCEWFAAAAVSICPGSVLPRVLDSYHNRLDLSSDGGDGTRSSSDGQRFGVRASSLLGVLYPR